MGRLIKFLWMASVIFFLILFLMVYSYMPEQVGLTADIDGNPEQFISRETFFYICLGVFTISNLSLYFLSKLLGVIPVDTPSNLAIGSITTKMNIINWVVSFSFVLNISYMLLMAFLGLFNNPGSFKFSYYHNYLVYIVPVLILIWLFGLVFLLLRRN